jgi:hypothetical protein
VSRCSTRAASSNSRRRGELYLSRPPPSWRDSSAAPTSRAQHWRRNSAPRRVPSRYVPKHHRAR